MASPLADAISLAGNSLIDGLVQGGAWRFSGNSRTLTYSLNINDTESSPGNPIGGTWVQYPSIADAVGRAFAVWSNVANISFASLGVGGVYNTSNADLAVTLTGDDLVGNFGAASLGIFPDTDFGDLLRAAATQEGFSYPSPEGDLFFDNFLAAFSAPNLNAGGLGFTYIVHEIGHALGLKHPNDDGANGRPTFSAFGIVGLDNSANTIMSQGAISGANPLTRGNVATPMPLDILAIQYIYGANTTFNVGDNVYVLADDGVTRTIWDAGGTDTFDASAVDLPNGAMIDLRAGAISTHGTNSRTAIAYNVIIDNVIGTGASDTLHGNDSANRIDGGTGESPVADTMIGHGGNDIYVVDTALDVVTEALNDGTDSVTSTATFMLPANVENLHLVGIGSIDGTGNELGNALTGNATNNVLRGGGGDDSLNGAVGFDTARYSGGYVQYSFVNYLEILRVVDKQANRDGVDQLIDVELLGFDGDNSTRAVTGLDQFTPLEYLASYADLYGAFGANPEAGYQHYVSAGRFEGRGASFDGMRYIASYADLMDGLGLNPNAGANHYINAGRFEGRVVNFEAMRYIASYGDLIQGLGANTDAAVVHYISAGRFEGRVAHFNGRTYIASYADLIVGLGDNPEAGTEHYVRTGYGEGRAVTFNALAYIASYADLIVGLGANEHAGAAHYINGGHGEGRVASFNAAQYLANYPDLQAAFGPNLNGAIAHYILAGHLEGRTDQPG